MNHTQAMIKIFFTGMVALLCSNWISAQQGLLKFADPLQSNMVVQQNKPFKIWGRAVAGQAVNIKADWLANDIQVIAGKDSMFLGIIDVPGAKENDFTKHQLSIESGGDKRVLDNLLIGDLWLCSGQSNMQFSMKEIKDSAAENADTDYPNIRLFNAGLNFSATPIQNISGKWQESTLKSVLPFSAVGFNFGKELYKQLRIPIGLVFSGIGASSAQAFVPEAVLAADTMLNRVYLQPYLSSDKSKEKIDGGFSFEKVTRPFLVLNALINPLANLSIKGICWYQGESNRHERKSYTHLTQEMIKSWRQEFGQGDLPFYYVQVAPFFYDVPDSSAADYAFFREAQENISQLNNTEMVVTMDVGESRDLHPKNKKPIGIRLAKTALNRTYGQLPVAYQGPRYAYLRIDRNQAIIYFDNESVASGLQTNNGKAPLHFFVAGKDRKFYPANAAISGNTVIVSSSQVKQPVAVRYAFTNFPVTNLENKEGLPVVPFRTDDWPEPPLKK
ncbi:MAG: sialate O-acetylesterase [Ferruginibacter sp.]|nr:sialate O-acetylesterase [Ferruginibacter sp.]